MKIILKNGHIIDDVPEEIVRSLLSLEDKPKVEFTYNPKEYKKPAKKRQYSTGFKRHHWSKEQLEVLRRYISKNGGDVYDINQFISNPLMEGKTAAAIRTMHWRVRHGFK